jgi:putative Ca2+/H+ antiporter (TMEM165/GDT1 family)
MVSVLPKLYLPRINTSQVTLGGALLFLIFGVIYLYEAFGRERSTELEMAIPGDNSII